EYTGSALAARFRSGRQSLCREWPCMRSLIFLAVALASTCLLGQDSSPDNTPTKVRPCAGNNPPQPCVVQPVNLTQPAPEYSDEGRKKRVQGELCLDFVVGVDGRTHDVRVTNSLG